MTPQVAELTFVSDLHLGPVAGPVRAHFLKLLVEIADRCRAGRPQRLYILGDLLSFWAERPVMMHRLYGPILNAIAEVVRAGCSTSLVDGNRDFGYGPVLIEATGAVPCGETTIIEHFGRKALLLHGDQLLTADWRYQAYKRVVRSLPVRYVMRLVPESMLIKSVRQLEGVSRRETAAKPRAVMEIDMSEAALLTHSVDSQILICGHVHHPRQETLNLADLPGQLFVLGAWDETGGTILEWPNESGPCFARWPR